MIVKRADSTTSGFSANAPADSPEYQEKVAIPVMNAVDSMPPEYRALVHEHGYVDVYRAWKRGWSVEKIREEARDGVFVLR